MSPWDPLSPLLSLLLQGWAFASSGEPGSGAHGPPPTPNVLLDKQCRTSTCRLLSDLEVPDVTSWLISRRKLRTKEVILCV